MNLKTHTITRSLQGQKRKPCGQLVRASVSESDQYQLDSSFSEFDTAASNKRCRVNLIINHSESGL